MGLTILSSLFMLQVVSIETLRRRGTGPGDELDPLLVEYFCQMDISPEGVPSEIKNQVARTESDKRDEGWGLTETYTRVFSSRFLKVTSGGRIVVSGYSGVWSTSPIFMLQYRRTFSEKEFDWD